MRKLPNDKGGAMEWIINLTDYAKASGRIKAVCSQIATTHGLGKVIPLDDTKRMQRVFTADEVKMLESTRKNIDDRLTVQQIIERKGRL
jgi:hypothetical protein